MEGMAHSFMTAGFFFGYGLNVNKNISGFKFKEKLSTGNHILRFFMYVVCGIPAIVFFLGYEMLKENFSDYDDRAIFKYFMFITYGFYTGFFTMFLAPVVFCKMGIGAKRDFVGFVEKGGRRSAHEMLKVRDDDDELGSG